MLSLDCSIRQCRGPRRENTRRDHDGVDAEIRQKIWNCRGREPGPMAIRLRRGGIPFRDDLYRVGGRFNEGEPRIVPGSSSNVYSTAYFSVTGGKISWNGWSIGPISPPTGFTSQLSRWFLRVDEACFYLHLSY